MNRCLIIYILKCFIPNDKILTLHFLLMFSRTQLPVVLLVSVYPLSILETFPTLTSIVSQNLALQQGASRLQTASADLWTFPINMTSPLREHFPLLNPTELHHCRVICIILWTMIKFYSSSSSSFSLAFVMCTFQCSPVIGHSLLASA
jgi:hypothetical protein